MVALADDVAPPALVSMTTDAFPSAVALASDFDFPNDTTPLF